MQGGVHENDHTDWGGYYKVRGKTEDNQYGVIKLCTAGPELGR